MTCPSCTAATPDGGLCTTCATAVATMIAAAPALIDQLDTAASKQARTGTGGKAGKGSAHTLEPVNWGAIAARDALQVELALWGDDLDAIRRHPQAAEIAAGIGTAVKNAYRAIDRAVERQYLGTCGTHCAAELWARPGAARATCGQCGAHHDVGDRRAWLLQQAANMLVTVKEASRYLGEIGHIRVTEASIRGYIHRDRIAYRPGGTMLRLGDLLAVVIGDSEARTA